VGGLAQFEGEEGFGLSLKFRFNPADISYVYAYIIHRMKAPLPKQRSLNPALPMVWLGLAVWGTVVMMSASNRPGPAGAPPARWPAESSLTRPVTKPTLIMFLEPNCVCSKASLGELSLLMDGCQGKLNARVLFIKAAGRSANWQQSDLWRQAMVIPGVGAAIDVDGREARLFGAQTSGEVVLYGADGRLLFQGGMTLYRGHMGDNPGLTALRALVGQEPSQVTQTPVFGCPLFTSNLVARR
jgi:hypothetical protein